MTAAHNDAVTRIVKELDASTARIRAMADEAHALVERLTHRPSLAHVKAWATSVDPLHVQQERMNRHAA